MKTFRIHEIAFAKFFAFVLLLYMNVIGQYYQIPHALLFLGILLGIPIVIYLFRTEKSLASIITTEIWLYILFFFITLVTGFFVALNKTVFISSEMTYIQTIILMVFLLTIVEHDKDLVFIEFLIVSIGLIIAVVVLSGVDSLKLALAGREEMFKGSVTKVNPNHVGLAQAASFTVLLFWLRRLNERHEITKNTKFFGLVLICIGLFITALVVLVSGSRKSFLAIVLSLGMFFIFSPKGRISRKIIGVLVASFIFIIVFYLGSRFLEDAYIFQRFSTFFDESSNTTRVNMIREGFQILGTSPFVGVGLGNFTYASSFGTYSHNTVAEALSTTGLIGSSIYFMTYISLFMKLIRLTKKHESRIFAYNGLILFVLLIFLSIGVIHFYSVQSALLFTYIIGGTMLYDTKRGSTWHIH